MEDSSLGESWEEDWSKLFASQTVDDEVDAAVEEDEVPGGLVHHHLPLRHIVVGGGEDAVNNNLEPIQSVQWMDSQ